MRVNIRYLNSNILKKLSYYTSSKNYYIMSVRVNISQYWHLSGNHSSHRPTAIGKIHPPQPPLPPPSNLLTTQISSSKPGLGQTTALSATGKSDFLSRFRFPCSSTFIFLLLQICPNVIGVCSCSQSSLVSREIPWRRHRNHGECN